MQAIQDVDALKCRKLINVDTGKEIEREKENKTSEDKATFKILEGLSHQG